MSDPITPPSPAPAPPPAAAPSPNPSGSFWLGFWLAWAALLGGYTLIVGFLASIASMIRGGGIADPVWIFLAFGPWLLIVALIVIFAANGKPRTAKGVAVGLVSIVAILLLLVAACFSLLAGTNFH